MKHNKHDHVSVALHEAYKAIYCTDCTVFKDMPK